MNRCPPCFHVDDVFGIHHAPVRHVVRDVCMCSQPAGQPASLGHCSQGGAKRPADFRRSASVHHLQGAGHMTVCLRPQTHAVLGGSCRCTARRMDYWTCCIHIIAMCREWARPGKDLRQSSSPVPPTYACPPPPPPPPGPPRCTTGPTSMTTSRGVFSPMPKPRVSRAWIMVRSMHR
jgi:hypothetical protein